MEDKKMFEYFEEHVSRALSGYYNMLKLWIDYFSGHFNDAESKEKAAMIIDNAAEKIYLLKKELQS